MVSGRFRLCVSYSGLSLPEDTPHSATVFSIVGSAGSFSPQAVVLEVPSLLTVSGRGLSLLDAFAAASTQSACSFSTEPHLDVSISPVSITSDGTSLVLNVLSAHNSSFFLCYSASGSSASLSPPYVTLTSLFSNVTGTNAVLVGGFLMTSVSIFTFITRTHSHYVLQIHCQMLPPICLCLGSLHVGSCSRGKHRHWV